jgi:rubrerythrin
MTKESINIADIFKYAINIEHESMLFYKEAVKRVSQDEVKTLLYKLSDDEVAHEARLTKKLLTADKDSAIMLDNASLETLIDNSAIPDDASMAVILDIALGREKNTRDFYGQISTMTNIDADIIDLFNELYNQESGHVKRISSLINSL